VTPAVLIAPRTDFSRENNVYWDVRKTFAADGRACNVHILKCGWRRADKFDAAHCEHICLLKGQ